MEDILSALYKQFYPIPENTPEAGRIRKNHRTLIEHFDVQDRKLVLQIVDDKDLICLGRFAGQLYSQLPAGVADCKSDT